MANEEKGPWWVVGVQIQAAMDRDWDRVETFLAEQAGQATDACLKFLRTIPAGVEVDLAPRVEHLGEQILAHTRFLCGQADLSATQAERLMAASRRGYDRFVEAFRVEVRAARGRPGAGLLPGIEAALAAGDRCDISGSPTGVSQAPELRRLVTSSPGREVALAVASRPDPATTASERIDPMDNMQRPGRRSTDPGGDSNSRALDRYEDEGGPGPEDTRDRGRDAPTSAPTGDRDVVDPGRVVVTPGSAADAFQVHHRDIPELHADGATPREAAANLAQDLAREIEGVADHYRRGLFGRVLDDVRAFVERSP